MACGLALGGCASDDVEDLGETGEDALASKKDDDGPFDPKVADEIGKLFGAGTPRKNVSRAVFLKPHGCAKATFTIENNLPAPYGTTGLFATPGTHDAWIRISSDTSPTTSDLENNTIGFAVKVLGVPGKKILAGEETFKTHDFLLQNEDVFFADTAQDMLEFTEATAGANASAATEKAYRKAHPRTDTILKEMAKRTPNVLEVPYWSSTTYRFGANDYAKYKVVPCTTGPAEALPKNEDNYLRARMDRDIAANGACFKLQVQLRVGTGMPLDAQTVEWSEAVSVPHTVATIKVAPQNVKLNEQVCENLAFTAWHALPAHQPVGSINKARGIVYKRLSDIRRQRNGVPIKEPE